MMVRKGYVEVIPFHLIQWQWLQGSTVESHEFFKLELPGNWETLDSSSVAQPSAVM